MTYKNRVQQRPRYRRGLTHAFRAHYTAAAASDSPIKLQHGPVLNPSYRHIHGPADGAEPDVSRRRERPKRQHDILTRVTYTEELAYSDAVALESEEIAGSYPQSKGQCCRG
jgi:hypothetical protein